MLFLVTMIVHLSCNFPVNSNNLCMKEPILLDPILRPVSYFGGMSSIHFKVHKFHCFFLWHIYIIYITFVEKRFGRYHYILFHLANTNTVEPLIRVTSAQRPPPDQRPVEKLPAEIIIRFS